MSRYGFWAVAASSSLALICLSGCGGTNDDSGPAPVTVSAPTATAPDASLATPTALGATLVPLSGETDPPMVLGVQTHFSQGWPQGVLAKADTVRAGLFRDSMPWRAGEPSVGTYDFTGATAQKLTAACASGRRLILTIVPEHPLYDGGNLVFSSAGRTAYAAYLVAVARNWERCIAAFEVGNEINGPGVFSYPSGYDPEDTYVALLRVARPAVRAAAGDVAILGGSTNMIGTGFLEKLFAAGMLGTADGVAVHPYRSHAESVDLEILHLREVMSRYGAPIPIWATEFSHDIPDRDEAAGQQLKMITLLGASGVATASWYALLDQSFFPNMGLFADDTLKPTGATFAFAQRSLLPLGRPVRVDLGDPMLFVYRYGADTLVVWGAPRSVTVARGATVRNAAGDAIGSGGAVAIGERPVVIQGAATVAPQPGAVLADTLLGYGTSVWQYFARTSDGTYHPLALFDGQYDSSFGSRWHKPLRIGLTGAAVAGDGSRPTKAIWRYTAKATQRVTVGACFSKSDRGDGVDYAIGRNGKVLTKGILTSTAAIRGYSLDLVRGDRLELIFGPNVTSGGDAFSYRLAIFAAGSARPVPCP